MDETKIPAQAAEDTQPTPDVPQAVALEAQPVIEAQTAGQQPEPARPANVTVADITPDEPYTMHAGVIRAFIDHILTGAPMIADGREGLNSLMLANAMLLSTWENATINLPFDDALYAGKLAALAAKSPKKVAKPIKLDVSKSF